MESYKKLAAKVEYRMAKNEQKVLVVTSVSENEGKSTVAANLAITLAEQSKRVLLVDGDIRRPSQFLIFGMEPKEENELGESERKRISCGCHGSIYQKAYVVHGWKELLFFIDGDA